MAKNRWIIWVVIIVVIVLLLVTFLGGFVSEEDRGLKQRITVDHLFVNSFLKQDYRSGFGSFEIEDVDLYGSILEVSHTRWEVNGVIFEFIETPSNSGGGGNFYYGSYSLTITSPDNRFLDTDSFAFLECDSFETSKENEYTLSVDKENGTIITFSYGGNPNSPYYDQMIEEKLEEIMVYLSLLDFLPGNCTTS
ncbi:MAG: hypothetical protein JSW08_03635 [archaeon]|nr:MAG: hypothetical protein JSW08_03635 [archaeon]